jgi:putative ABC transport system permease protein
MPFLLGLSLLAVGIVPLLRVLRVPDRVSYTFAGLAIVVVWLLPVRVVESFVPGAQLDFSMWIVGGLLIVVGAVWVVIYNADALMSATSAVLGRIRSLSAVLKISMAYPLRNRMRTGMTLAMFTLVVFNLVVGIVTPSSFMQSLSTAEAFGGGFDVEALSASPVENIGDTLRQAPDIDASAVRATGSVSFVPANVRQGGAEYTDYPMRGLDGAFLANTTYALGSRARGYETDAEVWDALAAGKRVAVVDPWIVPHRRNWTFGAFTDMQLSGIYAEDQVFDPITIDVRDPKTERVTQFEVIGILRDSIPFEMTGILTSQDALFRFGTRARPTMHMLALQPGVDPTEFATQLESALLPYGVEAQSFVTIADESVAGGMTFLRLIEGFMGLGLIVGVAALGVIAARSVVERRQQIGVLRAIGFRASTARLGFMLESAFMALTSIVVGTTLGLLLSYNIIDDGRRQATWPTVEMIVPWANLLLVFLVVMVVALATSYLPARRASHVYPAEALRYE